MPKYVEFTGTIDKITDGKEIQVVISLSGTGKIDRASELMHLRATKSSLVFTAESDQTVMDFEREDGDKYADIVHDDQTSIGTETITCPVCGGKEDPDDDMVCGTCHGEGTVAVKPAEELADAADADVVDAPPEEPGEGEAIPFIEGEDNLVDEEPVIRDLGNLFPAVASIMWGKMMDGKEAVEKGKGWTITATKDSNEVTLTIFGESRHFADIDAETFFMSAECSDGPIEVEDKNPRTFVHVATIE
jgi:hypothetical protein